MKKRKTLSAICLLGLWLLTGCLPGPTSPLDDDETPKTPSKPTPEPAPTGYAPESLSYRYAFAKGMNAKGDYYLEFMAISATQGYHANSQYYGSFLKTNYTYRKTGDNTAKFDYICDQYITNGVIPHRLFVYSGTLTYSSATSCKYVYSNTLNGKANESGTYNFTVIPNPPADWWASLK
ncbi:MAG: hypothetical protein LBP64_04540 [Tannerella sp.]|jgi:hypothetical protein|nr:hypothetical protein [Tannerella sp.]